MPEYLIILIRSLFSFIVLMVMTRLMGKIQLSQLTFFDYVVGITIGSIAAMLAVDQNLKILNGLMGIIVWGGLPILISIINLKSYRFRRLTDGRPTPLVENGNILEENLKKSRLTMNELLFMLRQNNSFKLSDVEFAVLETNGKLSVMKKSETQPVTPKLLNMPVEEEHQPHTVIIDGVVLETNLRETGYTKEWLYGEVLKQGASDFSDVFFAQITSNGSIYVDLRRDRAKVVPVYQKLLIKATMEKVYADLQTFSLETNNSDAKQMYKEQADKLQEVLENLQPYLKE
ncbi:DUF421 domain-containing protein [Paenibacillus macerans]|uniref:DUF421 domain-containing protein n=1 Tax=Paenibacillus macerans TaxID=44252 RepID=UPI003D30FC2D